LAVPRIAATTRSENVSALVAVLLLACLAAAGCGSGHLSIDKRNERQVAASWLGLGVPKVDCRGDVCKIGIQQSFVDASEAWLIAVPVTLYDNDPGIEGVSRIILGITDKRRGRVAVFRCSLRHESTTTGNRTVTTDVEDARKMCKAKVSKTNG